MAWTSLLYLMKTKAMMPEEATCPNMVEQTKITCEGTQQQKWSGTLGQGQENSTRCRQELEKFLSPLRILTNTGHGERLDEAEPGVWENHCRESFNDEELYFRINDPPLTIDGCSQAKLVAQSLKTQLSGSSIRYLFCSKLTRAVQTAYYIALEFDIPIILSGGFAQTAAAVVRKPEFRFLETSELQKMCPGVTLIDGDSDALNGAVIQCDLMLPTARTWHHPIEYVAATIPMAIIVAHRETIRNMAQRYISTPYCCYGVFRFYHDLPRYYGHSILHALHRPCGRQIDIGTREERPMKTCRAGTIFSTQASEFSSDVVSMLFGAEEAEDDNMNHDT